MKKLIVTVVSCLVLTAVALSARPVRNVSAARHPNIAAAQRLCQQAFDKITVAQQANEWDMQGHAKKAKELLDQASQELKEAALTANAAK